MSFNINKFYSDTNIIYLITLNENSKKKWDDEEEKKS